MKFCCFSEAEFIDNVCNDSFHVDGGIDFFMFSDVSIVAFERVIGLVSVCLGVVSEVTVDSKSLSGEYLFSVGVFRGGSPPLRSVLFSV